MTAQISARLRQDDHEIGSSFLREGVSCGWAANPLASARIAAVGSVQEEGCCDRQKEGHHGGQGGKTLKSYWRSLLKGL